MGPGDGRARGARRRGGGVGRRGEVGLRPDGGHRPRPAMGADLRGLGRRSLPGIGHGPGPGAGFQGDDPAAPDRVLACVKHWVAYGAAEGGRDYNAVDLSEQTLRTIYFPPFRAALEAGAGTVMSSFNTINGVPATANPFTLDRVLRREWQFDGLVVSDYEAVKELITHGVAANEADAARRPSRPASIWRW